MTLGKIIVSIAIQRGTQKATRTSKKQRFNKQTRFARAAHSFDLFVAVTARLQYDGKLPYMKNSRRLRPCPHQCVFVWKRIYFDAFRPSVRTNTQSVFIANASIWKRKRIYMRIRVDGRKRIKIKTMTENYAGASVCGMRIEFHLRHNEQYYRFQKF